MTNWKSLSDIRRQYGELTLCEADACDSPIEQFKQWFEAILTVELADPTAMVLSTVDSEGFPDSRVVLLKGIENGAFIFYTNYGSAKAQQLNHTPYAALNFYWPQMARQVRIRGRVKKTSATVSDEYFSSRPVKSQLSAIASPQSQPIESREEIEKKLTDLINQYGQEPIIRPVNWGGYCVIPDEMEFWQGRDDRLHDRMQYFKQNGQWVHRRLAP